MNILESLRVAVEGLFANKMRSASTMIGVIIGVSAVILLVSTSQGAKTYISSQIEEFGSNLVFILPGKMEFGQGPPTGENKLTLGEVTALRKASPSFGGVAAILTSSAQVKFGSKTRTTVVNGVTATYTQVLNAPLKKGKFILDSHIQGERKVACVSKRVAGRLFGNLDPIGRRITIAGQKFTIIGVVEEKKEAKRFNQDNVVYIPITAAQTLFGTGKVSQIIAKTRSPQKAEETIKKIKRILGERLDGNDFSVGSQEELLGRLKNFLNPFLLMLASIAGLSLLLGGLSIMNLMLRLVAERGREIGIRKVVGARSHHIFTQFVIEAAVLSVIGGAIGILLGTTGSTLLSRFLPSQIPLWSIPAAFGLSAVIGIFFGVYPAFKASRFSPTSALRYE